jgi:DNA invertase Pin-like site-specific DNA recombinase
MTMDNNNVRQQVFGLLNTIHENNHGHLFREINREELHYVVYLRKSSDETSDKQLKSIGDQLLDIKEKVLTPNKITHYKIVKEEHSAKTSDTRKMFRDMVNDLWNGKYEGLISWHPDRIARNMKEAGEIIDMLDRFVIKDLLFATASYENNANGKMMLGISFALSKQYSEHLGESVLRGYGRRIDEGIYLGKMVHGYRIMPDGFLEPDGSNFLIIQEAFQKRLQSKPDSLVEIAKWLNKQDYMQCYGRKQERSRTHFTDKKLSELFRESIYAGFLQYGVAKPVDLVELFEFEKMIEADDYLKLNKLDSLDRIVTRGVVTQNKLVTLLPGKVICGHCQSNMHVNTGTGKTKKKTYVYFRCDNQECPFKLNSPLNPRHNKHSLRASIVTNAAIETLEAAQFDLKQAYANYVDEQKKTVEQERIDLLSQERRVRANKQHTEADLERAKNVIADPDKADVAEYYKADIKKYIEVELPQYERELTEVKRKQGDLKQSLLTEEKFFKLIENSVDYLSKLDDLDQINEILEKFYSNFTILDKAVSVITFNPEWYDVLNPTWLGRRDSNPRILGPKPSALPLGHAPL